MIIYKLYDCYDGRDDLIGEYDDLDDLHKAKLWWIDETDGECDFVVEEYNIWE